MAVRQGPRHINLSAFSSTTVSPQLDIILSGHGQNQSYVGFAMIQANMEYKGGTSISRETNGSIKQHINTDGEVREEKTEQGVDE